MFKLTNAWYTDKFDVYRVIQTTNEHNVTSNERKLISENNRGRIYRKTIQTLDQTEQISRSLVNDFLACDVKLDIQPGDEIEVKKGFYVKKTPPIVNDEKYIVGIVGNFLSPFGGKKPDLTHKECSLQWVRLPEAKEVEKEKEDVSGKNK